MNGLKSSSYCLIKKNNNNFEVYGDRHCLLGTKLSCHKDGFNAGIYAEWSWDGENLKIENDRFGFYPIYYFSNKEVFGVSSSLYKLLELGASREISIRNLSVFMRLGFFIKEDTVFKEIKAVPPGSTMIWNNGNLSIKSKGYDLNLYNINLSYEDAIDQYREILGRSIQKRLPSKDKSIVLPLSGGKDSRNILLELMKNGFKPNLCVTTNKFFPSSIDDIDIAKQITNTLGLQHLIVRNEYRHVNDEISAFYHTNFCSDEQSWLIPMIRKIDKNDCVIYDGIGHDILLNGTLMDIEIGKKYEEEDYLYVLDKISKRYSDEVVVDSCLHDNFKRKILSEEVDLYIIDEIKKHKKNISPLNAFLFWNRTRREIALSPCSLFGKIAQVYCPLVDYDLIRFCFSLPRAYVKNLDFSKNSIIKAFPEHNNIPFEITKTRSSSVYNVNDYVKEFCFYGLKNFHFKSPYLNSKFIYPRIIRALIDKKYSSSLAWLCNPKIFYLFELQKISALKEVPIYD